jgi:ABC-2 type transport system permease protein
VNVLKALIKRELAEHVGGVVRAPFVVGGVLLVLIALSALTGSQGMLRLEGSFQGEIARYAIQNSPELMAPVAAKLMTAMSHGAAALINLVCAIVVLFYCLGALHDDRRDRSVLFWRSLPISDTQTVLSKVLIAAVIAPAIAFIATALTHALIWIGGSLIVGISTGSLNGVFGERYAASDLLLKHLLALPIHALWVLPVVGWLLLASAFAKSKPFLWAVLPLLGLAIADSWFDLTSNLAMPNNTVWKLLMSRIFEDPLPTSWSFGESIAAAFNETVVVNSFTGGLVEFLKRPGLWIGTLVGVAFIFAAIRLRRRSEDAY